MADNQKLQQIVERMVAAGESEQDIAAVIQLHKQSAPTAPEPEGKSVGGFLSNLATSTGKLIKDTAVGAFDTAKFLAEANPMNAATPMATRLERTEQVKGAVRNAPQIASAVGSAVKDRYGSLDAIGNTAYNDPAGVLSDLAAVLSLGGTATATKAPKVAGFLRKAESAINPIRVVEPAAKAVEYGTAGAIRPMLGPPTALVRQQRAPLEIERTALRTGAVTASGAGKKLGAAKDRVTAAADAATKQGRLVARDRVAQFPKTLDEVEGVTPNVRELDDLAALETETIASLPKSMTPSQLLEKRRAQDRAVDTAYRAEEKGGHIRSTADKGKKEIADNMRAAFREAVPEARESDDLTRRLGLVRGSLVNANNRPKTFPMSAYLAGGSGALFGGGPAAAVIGGTVGTGRLWPQIPLAVGSGPVRGAAAAAKATAHPASRRGLLLAALLERLRGDE